LAAVKRGFRGVDKREKEHRAERNKRLLAAAFEAEHLNMVTKTESQAAMSSV
jgi:hypothetical protein